MTDAHGILIRRVRLRPEHLPVPIYTVTEDGQDALPIPATWMGVVLWRDERGESYELAFFADSGEWLEGLEWDTLEIALDQGADIVGVLPNEWDEVHIPVPQGDDGPAWYTVGRSPTE